MSRAQADIIGAGALWGYSQLTRLLANDPHPLLTEVGLSEADLDDPDRFVSRSAAAALLDLSAARLGCSDFGLKLARMQGLHVLGAVAFAVRGATNRGDAIATMAKYVQHRSPMATMTVEPDHSVNEERIVFAHPKADTGVQLTELALGLFCRIDRHLTDDRHGPTRVTFTHAPISSPELYLEHFGVAPEFSAQAISVCVDQRELHLPLKAANPHLRVMIEGYLQLHAPAPGPDIDRRVREAVAQRISSTGNATVNDVSTMLHMGTRTLQRRLVEEGTTFAQVRDDVRRRLAETYLADDSVPLTHVPHLLGYGAQSVLTRSCARWFGEPPRAVREHVPPAHLHAAG